MPEHLLQDTTALARALLEGRSPSYVVLALVV